MIYLRNTHGVKENIPRMLDRRRIEVSVESDEHTRAGTFCKHLGLLETQLLVRILLSTPLL